MVQAGQHYLQVLGVVQFSILVGIEEFDKVVTISFTRICKAIFSQKVEKIERHHVAILIPIKPLKAAIGLKVKIESKIYM